MHLVPCTVGVNICSESQTAGVYAEMQLQEAYLLASFIGTYFCAPLATRVIFVCSGCQLYWERSSCVVMFWEINFLLTIGYALMHPSVLPAFHSAINCWWHSESAGRGSVNVPVLCVPRPGWEGGFVDVEEAILSSRLTQLLVTAEVISHGSCHWDKCVWVSP